MISRPKILIANDDGIYAEGIYALWEAMSEIGEVTVVAPDTEKSAVGHSITISDPIRIQKVTRAGGFKGYALDGTPADCVKIAVKSILKTRPDIVVSGINAGANVGRNIIYSGTISAATEGTILDIPSMAISFDSIRGGDLTGSKIVAKHMVKKILNYKLPKGTLLNVNVPNLPSKEIKGYQFTHQGNNYFDDRFEKREDPRGRFYYWMTGEIIDPDTSLDFDGNAIKNGYVSVTPVHFEMTHQAFLDTLKTWRID